ncbi:MAG: hypothetical protein MMC23_000578 [Stictis urceolatum]|nr:hypothetical protein [Stictis urceolata]
MLDHRQVSQIASTGLEPTPTHDKTQSALQEHKENFSPVVGKHSKSQREGHYNSQKQSKQVPQDRKVGIYPRLQKPLRFFLPSPSPCDGLRDFGSPYGCDGQTLEPWCLDQPLVPTDRDNKNKLSCVSSQVWPSSQSLYPSSNTPSSGSHYPISSPSLGPSQLEVPTTPIPRPVSSVYSTPQDQNSIRSMSTFSLNSESFSIISLHDLSVVPGTHPNPLASNPTFETLAEPQTSEPPPILRIRASNPALRFYASQPTTANHSRQVSHSVSFKLPELHEDTQPKRHRKRLRKPPPIAHAHTAPVGENSLTKTRFSSEQSLFFRLFPRLIRRPTSSSGMTQEIGKAKGSSKETVKTPPPLKRVSLHPPLASARYSASEDRSEDVVLQYKAGLREWDEKDVIEGAGIAETLGKHKGGRMRGTESERGRCLARAKGNDLESKGPEPGNESVDGWLWEARRVGVW